MSAEHAICLAAALVLSSAFVLILPHVRRTDPLVRGILVLIALFFLSRYLTWRVYSVVSAAELSVPYAIAVIVLVFEVFQGHLSLSSMPANRNRSDRTPEVEAHLGWWGAHEPRIDVFIPTYNENRDVLERTFVGARHLEYSNVQVHVLDDGRRDWVRGLAAEFGFDYITRSNNAGYKAGNINHGLAVLRERGVATDFLAVFDADFIARPEFLRRTLALFGPAHPRVGLVQTPQYFFNPDPFQYAFRAGPLLPDEQRAFFDYRLPVMDVGESALCCGTSFLVRMEALAEVGYFPGETICEDSFASLKLRDAGWKTLYLNEVLSVGLAPEGINEFLTQRYRWCLGWIQIAHLRCFGGKPRKRLRDVWVFLQMISKWPLPSVMRVVWTAMPLMVICLDSTVYQMSAEQFAGLRFPLLVAMYGLTWLSGFSVMPFFSDGQVLFVAPTLFMACWNFFTGRQGERFTVTDKGVSRDAWVFHWRPARLPLLLLALTIGVLATEVFSNNVSGDAGRVGIILWALLNCFALYVAIVPCFEPPQTRRAVRFRRTVPVTVRIGGEPELAAETVDVSERGLRIRARVTWPVGYPLDVRIEATGHTRAAVVRGHHRDGSMGVELLQSDEERRALIRWILASPGFVPEIRAWDGFEGVRRIFAHMVTPALRRRADGSAGSVRRLLGSRARSWRPTGERVGSLHEPPAPGGLA